MFTRDEAVELLGRRVHLGDDPSPACEVSKVIGAEPAGDGWVLLIQGLRRGAPEVLRCNRGEWGLYLRGA